ncbi:AMP-binding protein [Streptomyces sp. NBC_01497]|uniref:AMP-binding protein n=1 Tax=Streptomyces sp. NBC_01497 TaxID=2903885 RepID=UPI002E33F20E|nr:AMP-binding protein [Streptomyces sp. NBC_01497]
MSVTSGVPVLDLPLGEPRDPDEFLRAAMAWHFGPETGSPFWLSRAATLGFDPRTDVKTLDDLALFPNVTDELRDVAARDLIPQGYGPDAPVVGVYESGGTTGAPKRVVLLQHWLDQDPDFLGAPLDAAGIPRGTDWLMLGPTGPHLVGELVARTIRIRGGIPYTVDLDPRWVKTLAAAGRTDEVAAYVAHLLEQARHVLRGQRIGGLMTTPPLLEAIAADDELAELVGEKVKGIMWGGAHMDEDTRALLRTEVWPGVPMLGVYGSTMILGAAAERPGGSVDDPCVFDPPSPFTTFRVLDQDTGRQVAYGERGQVVMNHVSASFLLPNNLERDTAVRVAPPAGSVGDAVGEVGPLATFGESAVVEGVY